MAKIFLVVERGYYTENSRDRPIETQRIAHICAREQRATEYLQAWALQQHNNKLVFSKNSVVGYYDNVPWKNVAMNPITEKEFLENESFGGIEECYIEEVEMEE